MIFKKILFIVFLFLIQNVVTADTLERLEYKNIDNNSKIYFNGTEWKTKFNKNISGYFVKKIPEGVAGYSEFYSSDDKFLFSTATQYEFVKDGSLFGYSNYDLKFYEFKFGNDLLTQRELTFEEVQELFPDYKVIRISDFSNKTNCLKIKKKKRNLKLILLNDTDRYYYNYSFTTNNSKLKKYQLLGVLNISRKGMIQFSAFGENTKEKPWYVLLIR